VVRKSGSLASDTKMIVPDSVQYLDDKDVKAILEEHGEKNLTQYQILSGDQFQPCDADGLDALLAASYPAT
jgi:hypothetical protein